MAKYLISGPILTSYVQIYLPPKKISFVGFASTKS